jgi:PhnB protein
MEGANMQLNAYLNFNGQCEEAFQFYQKCLGGKIEAMVNHEGTPAAQHVPPEWLKKIMHARLNIDGQVLMGADSQPNSYSTPKSFCVSVQVKDPAEAERIFHALAENGKVDMPIQQTFWAARFGMLRDQYGIPWMVNCDQAS